ncbi:MAG: HNH endonuclease, partial [Clostridia bacterium]|nr:HNH endonuclease [Clostridia bacterium]
MNDRLLLFFLHTLCYNKIIQRIGNLTLLSQKINSSLKNSDFNTKKEIYAKSSFSITQE